MTVDVSIIIPVFNSAETLQRAVYSTVNQGVSSEIILVNDGSEDNSLSVAEKLKQTFNQIVIINLNENSGVSAARNRAINVARGKYIAFLDADDVWLPGKLKAQKDIIENNSGCTMVSCDSLQIDPTGRVLRRAHAVKPAIAGKNAWKSLLAYNYIPTPTVFARTGPIKEIGGFNESLVVSEDLDLWISLAKKGSVEIIPEVFVHYFDYSQSLMKRGIANSYDSTIAMIQKHMSEDSRLTEQEKRQILSTRYYYTGMDALSSNDDEKARRYLNNAIDYGYSIWLIRIMILKRSTKKLIGEIF